MAKGPRQQFSSGSKSKPAVETRAAEPKIRRIEKDQSQILCPFCVVPHPITIGKEAACGTMLVVRAVQNVYPHRTVSKQGLICIKCNQGGGEMVRFNNSYVHLPDCTPETKLLAEIPKFSRLAVAVFGLPTWLREIIEKWTGKAQEVKEIDTNGVETGKVLGYFFLKRTA